MQSKSMDWFLYHNDLGEERVKGVYLSFHLLNDSWTRGFELGTRGFELLTCGFEIVIRGFELATREFELINLIW